MTATAMPLTSAEAALAHLHPATPSRRAAAMRPSAPTAPPSTRGHATPAGQPVPQAAAPEAAPRAEAASEPVSRSGARTGGATASTARVRLIPHMAPGSRPRAASGPGPVRPPTLEERASERRRSALQAARHAPETAEPGDDALPEPTSVCCSIVLVALEVLTGARSLSQLARWVTPELYEQLAARAAVTERSLAPRPTQRPEVRRARVCRLGQRVAEASIVVQDGPRVRAVAVRLEERRGAWRAVALEIG